MAQRLRLLRCLKPNRTGLIAAVAYVLCLTPAKWLANGTTISKCLDFDCKVIMLLPYLLMIRSRPTSNRPIFRLVPNAVTCYRSYIDLRGKQSHTIADLPYTYIRLRHRLCLRIESFTTCSVSVMPQQA